MGKTTQKLTQWEWLSVYINSGYSFNLFVCVCVCGLTMGACETLVLHSQGSNLSSLRSGSTES